MNNMHRNRKTRKGTIPRPLKFGVEPKFIDTLSLANSVGSGGTLFDLCLVPQGGAQSQRIGDFLQPLKCLFNFSLYTVNSDIVTTVRLIFIRWIVHTALSAPSVVGILQNAGGSNVLSHFDFATQDNYVILSDRQYQQAGIPAAPTVSSNIGATGMNIPIKHMFEKNVITEIEFNAGATTGSNKIFLLAISDSALVPFPILNFSNRLYYEDTVRDGKRSLVH